MWPAGLPMWSLRHSTGQQRIRGRLDPERAIRPPQRIRERRLSRGRVEIVDAGDVLALVPADLARFRLAQLDPDRRPPVAGGAAQQAPLPLSALGTLFGAPAC